MCEFIRSVNNAFVAQSVEHHLGKVVVASSILAEGSKKDKEENTMPTSAVGNDDARELKERWFRNDESLTLAERVFILEKMVRRLLFMQKTKKDK